MRTTVHVLSSAGCCWKTKGFVRLMSPFGRLFHRARCVHYHGYTVLLRPSFPEVAPWILIGNNKVKCINIQPIRKPPCYCGCNCGNMAHITQGVSTKTSTAKSALHISQASEEVTSPHQCLGLLGCSEHEQSSARGYVKTCCQLCNVSTQLQTPEPYQPLLPAPSTLSGIKDALSFQ